MTPIPSIGGEFRSYRGLAQPFAPHSHDHYVIGRVEAGERVLELNDSSMPIIRGNLIIFNPGDVHGCIQKGQEPLTYDSFAIPAALFDGVKLRLPAKGEPNVILAYDDVLRALRGGSNDDVLERILLLASLLEIDPPDAQHTVHEKAALRVHIHLCKHLGEPAKIGDLAAMEGLSEYALIRAYRKCFHITPLQHLISLRVECACQLLRKGASATDVAVETGFSDQAHLTRVFKQRIGTTPAAYRAMTCNRGSLP